MKKIALNVFIVLTLLFLSVSARTYQTEDIKINALVDGLVNFDFSVSARIYFGYEDETNTPVTGKFYLLDESVVTILQKANINPVDDEDQPLTEESDYLEAVANTFAEPGAENGLLSLLILDAVRNRQVAEIATNRFGSGKSGKIKAGLYYLFAVERVENEIFVWNLPVYLSGSSGEIEIDQYNAESSAAVQK